MATRLKIGSKFRWLTQRHHVLGFAKDNDEELIVAKYWRGRSWGYEVIPVWLYVEVRRRDRRLAKRKGTPK